MQNFPPDLLDALRQAGQEHLADGWVDLSASQQQAFLAQLAALDLGELAQLYQQRDRTVALPAAERIAPVPRAQQDAAAPAAQQARELAREALRAGEVAYLVVAGGQGSRLGFDQPKGMFPIGPVSGKSLFQLHAEKILAIQRRHGARVPWLVMTSPATDAGTRAYFRERQGFGLAPEDVEFFCQGTMPALDLATGRLLLEGPGRLFLSPNGHGGTLTGLADSGLLERLHRAGVRALYYFQVDNPLVNLADLDFLGQHLAQRAEVSSKAIVKTGPTEKVGNFVLIDGRCAMIEYSDLPASWARRTDEAGQLHFWAGSPAIHLFDLEFLRRIARDAGSLPWHVACKKVPYWHAGQVHAPSVENALKFERFIFDVLPLADRWTLQATVREREFAPVKNAEGPDSPATARAALCNLAAEWLAAHRIELPRDDRGQLLHPVEISPLLALDAEELGDKLPHPVAIERPTYLE